MSIFLPSGLVFVESFQVSCILDQNSALLTILKNPEVIWVFFPEFDSDTAFNLIKKYSSRILNLSRNSDQQSIRLHLFSKHFFSSGIKYT